MLGLKNQYKIICLLQQYGIVKKKTLVSLYDGILCDK